MFTMYLAFAANVKQMMNADATALMVLALLALGTFTAGIQTDSWRISRALVWSGSYSVLPFLLSLGSNNQHYSSYWWSLWWARSPSCSFRIIGAEYEAEFPEKSDGALARNPTAATWADQYSKH
jgi:hypothetical protein